MGGVQDYNYKPLLPRFQKAPTEGKVTKNAFHMGFEVEIAPRCSFLGPDALIHMLKDHIGKDKIYGMEDGSISEACGGQQGMEIASHPFTWEFYKKIGYKDWDKMCLYLKDKGWTGKYNGLGIHVHTTKAAWGTHQIYKLLKFVYENQSFICFIAQRPPTNYCRYDMLDGRTRLKTAKDKHQLDNGNNHYDAINLNNGDTNTVSKTIEFRIFQSRLEPLYFHKNIEFTHACYQFTRQSNRMTQSSFEDFMLREQRTYPCLFEFMRKGE